MADKVGEDARVPALLSIIGGKAYSVLRDLMFPALPQEATYDTLVATLKKHYEPNVCVVIAERFHFHQRCQGPEESIGISCGTAPSSNTLWVWWTSRRRTEG